MSARLRLWWSGRSLREQRLLLAMFALLAVVIVWLGILLPVSDGLSRARDRHAAAVIAHGDVLAKRDALRALLKGGPAPLDAPLESIVRQTAGEAGFAFASLTADGPEHLTLTIANARPAALFGWIAKLEARGILVERLTVRDNGDPTLNVDLALRGRTR